MYRRPAHDEMGKYKVWKYAANLFRKALLDKPKYWMNHYMLGKCLWKLYCKAPVDEKDRASRPNMSDFLQSFVRAIETAPKQKDTRSELTLEPHYKLMSIVHRLVMMRDMEPQEGANLLQRQPFAIRKGEEVNIKTVSEWDTYILECFRHIRNADKSHWHHRMISRVVNILYNPSESNFTQATAARNEFRESILTKTMHVQVWKPEAERPGRHHVYMERYVRLIIKILFDLEDKTSMEGLAKRVRKRAGDYWQFNIVWQECCMAYLKLIRKFGSIPPNTEDVFKGVSRDEFELFSQRLEEWMANPDLNHPALDALREVIELKKLNQNLMKGVSIDDAIHDAYAVLYSKVSGDVPLPDLTQATGGISQLDGEGSFRSQGPMSLNNLVMNMNGPPVPANASGSAAPISLGNAESVPHPRRVGIRRTEVIKKAEAAITKAAEVARPSISATSRPSLSHPTVTLASNAAPHPSASTPRNNYSAHKESEAKDDSSAPGSVHDSADDESDLSDVPDMEDADEASIFPNLHSRETNNGQESSAGEEEEEEEGEEEDGDEEDEGEEEEADEEAEQEFGEGEDGPSPRKDSDTNMEG
ncbi:Histone transcription regulator 3-like protein [Phlyctema vagabunda]|uniref:Histone transcription regulator 3 homolog n=1 Tax=Phlyctema vagabunda TaxID=108571 RepID=A0ABR4PCA8_9HELO